MNETMVTTSRFLILGVFCLGASLSAVAAPPASTNAPPSLSSPSDAALPEGFRAVTAQYWVSGYLRSRDEIESLRRLGIQHVISLVPANELPEVDEAGWVKAAELRFHAVPIAGPEDLTRASIETVVAHLHHTGGEKTLIHCASTNRVGAVMALKAAWIDGLPLEDAIAIGRQYGLKSLESDVRARVSP